MLVSYVRNVYASGILSLLTAAEREPTCWLALLFRLFTNRCRLHLSTRVRSDGSVFQSDMLRREVLYPTLDQLQIPRSLRCAGFHNLRHSAGSFVKAETGNLKLAQKLLGHSNLSPTADIHTYTPPKQNAMPPLL